MTISAGLRPWGPSTHSSAAWDPKDIPHPTHTPLAQNQTLKGAERERQKAKITPHTHPLILSQAQLS